MPSAPPTLTSPDAPPPPSSFDLHTNRILHIGTRSSALALAQTQLFVALLSDSSSLYLPFQPLIQIHPTTTTGDQNLTTSLSPTSLTSPANPSGRTNSKHPSWREISIVSFTHSKMSPQNYVTDALCKP